jgi:hypothetical protein
VNAAMLSGVAMPKCVAYGFGLSIIWAIFVVTGDKDVKNYIGLYSGSDEDTILMLIALGIAASFLVARAFFKKRD